MVDQDPLLAVPLHELLVLVPRLALHVAAVAVVQDATVARPAERPLGVQTDAGLVLGVAAAQRLLCRVERSVVVVPHAGVDPHRARGGTVGAQLGVTLEQVGLRVSGIDVAVGAGDAVAVEGPGHGARVDLAVHVVVPLGLENRVGVGAALLLVQVADGGPKQVAHLVVGLGLTPRLDGLVAVLDPTSGVQDDARLLVDQRARQIVNRGVDLGRVHIRRVPEAGGLGDDLVGDDQPIAVGHGTAHVAGVRSRMAGVHAPIEVALDNALLHELERHRGCQRSSGCFEKAPCVTGSCPSLLSYSSCTRLKTDAKPPTVPSCRLEAAGRRRRSVASHIRIVRIRMPIHAHA